MSDDAAEKEEEPTAKKRADSREEGQVNKSPDVSSAFAMIGGALCLMFLAGPGSHTMTVFFRQLLNNLEHGVHGFNGMFMLFVTAKLVGPIAVAGLTLSVVGMVVQTGWLFSVKKLMKPDFKKFINPLPGLKKMVASKQSLAELAFNMVKMITLGAVCYDVLVDWVPSFVSGQSESMTALVIQIWDLIYELGIKLTLAMIVIASIDFAIKKYFHEENLKMSKQEIKDEGKNAEGDPKIKQKRRQLGYEMIFNRSVAEVPEADVVVANPTHFSVAIKYDPETMEAPKVVAKGADEHAMRIRQIAKKHGVPIVVQPPLARALFKQVKRGRYVPVELYEAIARILAYVYKLRGNRKRRGAA